jgi:HEAT repeat protein
MLRALGFALICTLPGLSSAATPDTPWDTLQHFLHSDVGEHRRQALAALSTLDASDERAVKAALEALHDKSVQVRQSAALALGRMKAKQAIPDLKAALDDDDEVAFAAAKSLVDLGDAGDAREMMIDVLSGERKDAPGIMTNAMRTAKRKLRHPGGLILMGAEDAAGTMFAPAGMGIMAAQDAIALKGKGAPGRVAAVAYLAKDPDAYAVTLLEWALGDDNHLVRLEAARGLSDRGNAGSLAKLQPLLDDSHTSVRVMAAASMLKIQSRESGTTTTADRAK